MTITMQFHFVDGDGNDISGTREVDGYHWADFFDDNFESISQADSIGAADALLQAAYKGPDSDGVGVKWTLEEG